MQDKISKHYIKYIKRNMMKSLIPAYISCTHKRKRKRMKERVMKALIQTIIKH